MNKLKRMIFILLIIFSLATFSSCSNNEDNHYSNVSEIKHDIKQGKYKTDYNLDFIIISESSVSICNSKWEVQRTADLKIHTRHIIEFEMDPYYYEDGCLVGRGKIYKYFEE